MSLIYETVIGLEVHVELNTKTKIFCSCPTTFGAPPNTQCCPVCTGMPGALPVLNRRVVEYALRAGLATHCTVNPVSGQDRKHYFYPDLPKAYQISQYERPLCENGYLNIRTPEGARRIGIARIHMEEDAGKLIHDTEKGTMIDMNRCGIPLIEIVTAPDLRTATEARTFLQALRTVLLYAGVTDGKMNEGSLRCDVNLSVRRKGDTTLGTRTEIKNVNSFAFVAKAIEAEAARQIGVLEQGGLIVAETRRFDPATGQSLPMRRKEEAHDYRYAPDPDLPPVRVDEAMIRAAAEALPPMPDERMAHYRTAFGLTEADAETVTARRSLADYFEEAIRHTAYPKLLANLLLAEPLRRQTGEDFTCPITPAHMGKIADLFGKGVISSSTVKTVIGALWAHDEEPEVYVNRLGLAQIDDPATLMPFVQAAMAANASAVADYRRGKTAAAGAVIGHVMKSTGGRAQPDLVRRLVGRALDERTDA